ncbi:hypothetical protein GCM10022247_64250 [Allokutzneria multivorans]|uniref:Uncharacterized protein n=1 Tax=Allokutzneria multivorans TaxID=1142134 RepID=A0ABP7TSF7_9PSEU
MSVQLVEAPLSAFAAAGDVEAELSVLSTFGGNASGDDSFGIKTVFTAFPGCCSLVDF